MKIEAKYEFRVSVAGQHQQPSVQVSQGKVNKGCFLKKTKEQK
jgi:hypothetical protein